MGVRSIAAHCASKVLLGVTEYPTPSVLLLCELASLEEMWACFDLGMADSSALPASSQKLAWADPAWLEIWWDHSAVGIRGTLFSITDILWLNLVVMRPDLLLCSPCFALHNSTNTQRASKFDPCFLRIVKFSFCTNLLAEFKAWFIKRAFPLRVNVIALSPGLQDKCS